MKNRRPSYLGCEPKTKRGTKRVQSHEVLVSVPVRKMLPEQRRKHGLVPGLVRTAEQVEASDAQVDALRAEIQANMDQVLSD